MLIQNKLKPFFAGIVIGTMISCSVAFASNNSYVLSLFKAKIIVNGEEKNVSDVPYQYFNGQSYVPTSLNYNGTTYVPIRFFSESLGQKVEYDPKTTSIYIDEIPKNSDIGQNVIESSNSSSDSEIIIDKRLDSNLVQTIFNHFKAYTENNKELFKKTIEELDELWESEYSNYRGKTFKIKKINLIDSTSEPFFVEVIMEQENLTFYLSVSRHNGEWKINFYD